MFDVVRRAAPFAELPRSSFEGVLDMLSGRYPSDEFAELRPRVTWDRVGGVLSARRGARRLAVVNAGTIPDRGLYGVFLADGGAETSRRVGELDEEMVFESRPGEIFLLGASSWRIEDITHDRVMVTPAPGEPGKLPFWHGDRPGRAAELGRAIGELARKLSKDDVGAARNRLEREHGFDARAANNLVSYLAEQKEATGVVPSDRELVVERFIDEIGDWRVCLLSPYGARVHAPWALSVAARYRRETGTEAETIWSDDGIVLRFPEADEPPDSSLFAPPPEEVNDAVIEALGTQRAVRGALSRERRARAAPAAPLSGQAQPALGPAQAGFGSAAGGGALRLVPDHAGDVPGVPAGRVRRAGPGGSAAPGAEPASAPHHRGRARSRRRSRRRSCSATSRTSCTRATRPWPSGAPRR